MQSYSLKAQKRSILGKKVKGLRESGQIPAVVYGGKKESQSLSLSFTEFDKIYRDAGSSSIVDLEIDDKETDNVLIQEPQYNAVSGLPQHVDFLRVKMDEKIKTEIPLEFIGESKAVEQLGGTLVTPHDKIEVECLPKDLVPSIKIDLGSLNTFNDQIKISDINIPEGLVVDIDENEVVALVEAPRSEEEMAELETPTAEEEQKAVEEVAGEKEEGAEGTEETTGGEESAPEAKTDQAADNNK